jgi:hypothetical protein
MCMEIVLQAKGPGKHVFQFSVEQITPEQIDVEIDDAKILFQSTQFDA